LNKKEKLIIFIISLIIYFFPFYYYFNYQTNSESSKKEKEFSIEINIVTPKKNKPIENINSLFKSFKSKSNKEIIKKEWVNILLEKKYKSEYEIYIKNNKIIKIKEKKVSTSKEFENYILNFLNQMKTKKKFKEDEIINIQFFSIKK
jgi:hypothetical protein